MKKIFTLLIGIVFSLTILNAQEAPPQAFSYKATIQRPNGNLVVTKTISLRISILQNNSGGIAVYTETFLPTTNTYGQIDIEIGHGTVVTGDFSTIDWSADKYFLKVEVDIKAGSNYTVLSVTQLLSIPYALYAGRAGTVKNELDPLFSAHPANGITIRDIGNWNTAFGWGNHALQGYALSQNVYTKFDLQTSGNSQIHWNNLTNKPDFATVATTGNYSDLNNLPIIPYSLNQITPDAGNRIISNVATPVNAQDAATKSYVDVLQERVSALEKLLGVGDEDDVATDIDGNVYDTVVIGTQVWMKQNLKVTRYRNGDTIPNITGTEWGIQSSGAYCLYNNDIMSDTIYGALYNWYAVADSRNICPTGWHVPTDGEWTVLTTFLGGETIAGDKLKEAGTAHWQTPNSLATDEFGYTALPGGYRDPGARFANQSVAGFWWSSTENNADYAISRLMAYNISRVGMSTYPKKFGKSVRCLKGEAVPVNLPVVTTMDITNITANGANSGGRVISDAGSTVTARGVCWNMAPSPIIAYSKTFNGADTGAFVSALTNLQPGRTYFVRAYATNVSGTAYGNEVSFTTNPGLPTVNTSAITSITSTTAISGGSVNWDGGAAVTQRGICWSISSTPTTADRITLNGSGNGAFISNITGLSPNTVYYVRAYALNSIGTGYGPIRSFTTSNAPLTTPTVYTDTITSITSTTAIGGGYISKDGGFPISDRGVCYSTSMNPTTANIRISNGADTGRYICNLTGLISSTTYYVRAYAINSSGTAYGQEMSFKTLAKGLAIGDSYQGGNIAYILQPDDPGYVEGQSNGLIVAPTDQSTAMQWSNGSYVATGATATGLGTGRANTDAIVNSQGAGSYAAKLCYDLVLGGYSDWFLPSKEEVNKLYINRAAIGSFANTIYWSSTESNNNYAWGQNFYDGNQSNYEKSVPNTVRAVRSFSSSSVITMPTATISGPIAVCRDAHAPITFTGANGTAPYTFTYKLNGGSNQTVTTTMGNSVNVPVSTVTPGIFTYTLVSVYDAGGPANSQAQTGFAIVTVNPLPTAIISGTTTVSINAPSPNITFSGASGMGPYTFTYNINNGTNQTVTTTSGNSVTVSVPTGSVGTFTYNLVSVMDASVTSCIQAQTGSAVVTVNPLSLAIGDNYQGGKVAYILQPGDPGYMAGQTKGLIAAPSDQSTGIQWYNGSYIVALGATATGIGTGNANTNAIVNNQGAGNYAAKLCYDLVLNGYSDWYLPSKDELNMLCINKDLIGGIANNFYWSSTEYNIYYAWLQYFGDSWQNYLSKDYIYYVRAVRSF